MTQVILATTNPLNYRGEFLGKNHSSLKKVAQRKTLPLVLEHDGERVGVVTNLAYELRDGVGYLLGYIRDFMGKVGTSLQYAGTRSVQQIRISSVDHVALTDTPRDPIALFSDSTANATRYRDSVEGTETTTETQGTGSEDKAGGTETEADPAPQGTEIELTDEVIDQLYDSLFSDPRRLADLVQRIKGTEPEPKEGTEPEPQGGTEPEPKPDPTKATPTRIIIKPRTAVEAVQKKVPTPIQRPFKGLP